jgi:uncharacterized membrane protein required for colicin V production
MGLDIFLGIIVLVAALRGWFRGFWSQGIRVVGLVASVYLAGPVRDAALPFVTDHVGSIDPDLLRRLLWWLAAALSFIVLTGLASGFLATIRRRRSAEGYPAHRGDQSTGFLFGAAKGALAAAFLAAGLEKYSADYIENGGWLGEQVRTSKGLALTRQYRPVDRIWASEPVRRFVSVVRSQGLDPGESDPPLPGPAAEPDTVPLRTARRPGPLQVSPPSEEEELERALDQILHDLQGGPSSR